MPQKLVLAVATVATLAIPAREATAQTDSLARATSMVTVIPGPHYRASGLFTNAILGSGWRDLWSTPITVPVLDPATYAGGLKFDRRGGNRQSITVHWKAEKGPKEYVFRSVDKYPLYSLAPEFQGTLVGRIIQDQTSAFFPAGAVMVPPLLNAIGALNLEPTLYVMANSARLENVRDTVAGMLGAIELKPKEGPDDTPGFAGSTKIEDSEEFLEEIRDGHGNRLDEREFLAVRLVDMLVNDPDRTLDNYDWARFGEKGDYTWRPIARDRDWAFMNSRGLINTLIISSLYPKFPSFGPSYKYKALVFSSFQLDRRLLQRLNSRDFHEVATRVQQAITDQVIARAVAELPESWRTGTSAPEELTLLLRARRDKLTDVAMTMYRDLASDVDVHGTDEGDRAEIVRHDNGNVTLTITALTAPAVAVEQRESGRVVTTVGGEVERPADVWYQRTFIPHETSEIRVFLGEGDDVATIRGARNGAITVRLIGEKGDDVLADSVGAGATLYDEDGSNRFITGGRTRVSTKPWTPPEAKAGLKLESSWRPDWGGSSGWSPYADHHTGAGVVVGFGPRIKSYGFRRLPHHWKAGAYLLYGTANGRWGVTGDVDYRFENSPMALTLDARASQIEGFRFFGFGNDSPDMPSELALVEQRVIAVEPALVRHIGWRSRDNLKGQIRGEDTINTKGLRPLVGKLSVGPTMSWFDAEPPVGSPFAAAGFEGEGFSVGGARVALELDRTNDGGVPTAGWKLKAATAAYPLVQGGGLDDGKAFGTATGSVAMYVPIVVGGPHFAFRLGGGIATDGAPVQFSPYLGGRSTLRGYSSRRFTGDAAANAGAEFRLPVGTVNFLLNSQLGLFGLAEAGRVWLDGESDGGWHPGLGGGFWLAALGKSVSVAYAHGEAHKLYLKLGMSY